ncbi:MAG: ABC transporter permease [Deltaproteobacteria bacterium]|nr:ABC transporter permease [Deltaproteobacteria bacterium]
MYFSVRVENDSLVLFLQGTWRVIQLNEVLLELNTFPWPNNHQLIIDGSTLSEIDTSSINTLLKFLSSRGNSFDIISWRGFSKRQQNLIDLVKTQWNLESSLKPRNMLGIIEQLGKGTLDVGVAIFDIFSFIGQTLTACWRLLSRPKLFRYKEFVVQLELACVNALPICSLVTFLIGLVVAYLFAGQFEKYGANIFIVDSVALAMCRELSPIIVAIIIAGRSGSAFTAQIGTMKISQEIEAMTVLGLSYMQVLVLPRVLALVIALPLLVFIGDLMGIFGGLAIANLQLGVTGSTFIDRLQAVLTARHVLVGLIKAPAFAFFIALIGCHLGLQVEDNARSVGLNTTATVVRSIVAVILLNAAFAIIFVKLGV